MNTQPTIKIFCAKCQAEEDHISSVDSNGDLVFHCAGENCDRFLKLPAGLTTEEYRNLLVAHEESNKGQVSLQDSINALDALAESVNSEALQPAQEQPVVEVSPDVPLVDPVNAEEPVSQPSTESAVSSDTIDPTVAPSEDVIPAIDPSLDASTPVVEPDQTATPSVVVVNPVS